jgi:hypothetical protein
MIKVNTPEYQLGNEIHSFIHERAKSIGWCSQEKEHCNHWGLQRYCHKRKRG